MAVLLPYIDAENLMPHLPVAALCSLVVEYAEFHVFNPQTQISARVLCEWWARPEVRTVMTVTAPYVTRPPIPALAPVMQNIEYFMTTDTVSSPVAVGRRLFTLSYASGFETGGGDSTPPSPLMPSLSLTDQLHLHPPSGFREFGADGAMGVVSIPAAAAHGIISIADTGIGGSGVAPDSTEEDGASRSRWISSIRPDVKETTIVVMISYIGFTENIVAIDHKNGWRVAARSTAPAAPGGAAGGPFRSRMTESWEWVCTLINTPELRDVPIVLVFTHADRLRDALRHGRPLSDSVPGYVLPSGVDAMGHAWAVIRAFFAQALSPSAMTETKDGAVKPTQSGTASADKPVRPPPKRHVSMYDLIIPNAALDSERVATAELVREIISTAQSHSTQAAALITESERLIAANQAQLDELDKKIAQLSETFVTID